MKIFNFLIFCFIGLNSMEYLPHKNTIGCAHPHHPSKGCHMVTGISCQVPLRSLHDNRLEEEVAEEEKPVSVNLTKLKIEHIVTHLGGIARNHGANRIIKNLMDASELQGLVPCLLEVANSGKSDVGFDYEDFLKDYANHLNIAINANEYLGSSSIDGIWIGLNVLGAIGCFGMQLLLVKFVSNYDGHSPSNHNSTSLFSGHNSASKSFVDALKETAVEGGVQISFFSGAGFCIRNGFQRLALINARRQVCHAIAEYVKPAQLLCVRSGETVQIILWTKISDFDAFEQTLFTTGFGRYIKNLEDISIAV